MRAPTRARYRLFICTLFRAALFCAVGLIVSCSSGRLSMRQSVGSQTLSSGDLTVKVREKIAKTDQLNLPACSRLRVQQVELKNTARGSSGQIISARENWHIHRCGRRVIYQVDYYGPLDSMPYIHVQKTSR